MKIRPMEYTRERTLEALYQDNYKGFNYFIISYGTHPCAYVELPKDHPLYGISYIDIEDMYNINVHGGLTYSTDSFLLLDNTWIIGWDYSHCYDYSTYSRDCSFLKHELKMWTTEEMIDDCISVIDQLIEIKLSGGNNE